MSSHTASPSNAMLLNLQMIADPMDELLWEYTAHLPGETPYLRSCMLYCCQSDLRPDVLYVLPEELGPSFPTDHFSYITIGDIRGKAPHIRNVHSEFPQLFNLILSTFQRYYEFETQLNSIITREGNLTELCYAASAFFHNPVYIHDDLFSVIAHSSRVEGMLQFEYNEKTNKLYIPLWLIEEFKFDESYAATLTLHQAGIWGNDQYPYNIRSLFVNLWDGQRYCGRLLINEIASSLLPGQFRAIEYLANYVILLLRHLEQSKNHRYRNFEETLIALISGEDVDVQDLRTILRILDWSEADQFTCLKLRNQNTKSSIRSDSALNNVLSSILKGSVIFHDQQDLCILLNSTRSTLNPRILHQQLAPHIRDCCMYAGISNPVDGIRAIGIGFRQADIALSYITQENSSDWIVFFSACALSYIRRQTCTELPDRLLAHPVLLNLIQFDQANGTQYYETLRVFLSCERNIPLAANQLIIHRTTLTYRLKKIQELTLLNLDDPDLRLYLLFSFYLLDNSAN